MPKIRRKSIENDFLLIFFYIQSKGAAQSSILMILRHPLHRSRLHDSSEIHHRHPVADLRHHAQVVGDQDNGGVVLVLQFIHQFEDLGLDRHVQSRGGLVRNQNLGVAGQAHGDHHPLEHTAGQLEGIGLHHLLRPLDSHIGEQLHGAL